MIKKIFALVIISSLASAVLLFLGTTVMAQFSPALASSLDALVAGTDAQPPKASLPVEEQIPLKIELSSKVETPEASSASPASPALPLKVTVSEPAGVTPITGVTIAQLLATPDQFRDKLLTITGKATRLDDEKFLLNDGTGQIMVELDDDPGKFIVVTGTSITITGIIDEFSSHGGLELEACTVTDGTGTFDLDDCDDEDDDSMEDPDDSDDDTISDDDDDADDDKDDDSMDDSDDETDDDEEDDSLDDSSDDSEDDSEDDSGEIDEEED